jgi:threonine dehydratase
VGESLRAGEVRPVPDGHGPTICDALQPPVTKQINVDVLRAHDVLPLTVIDAEVAAAMRFAFTQLKLVVEPGGAAALAAVLAGKVDPREGTVITLSGGNVAPALFAAVLNEAI